MAIQDSPVDRGFGGSEMEEEERSGYIAERDKDELWNFHCMRHTHAQVQAQPNTVHQKVASG